MAIQTRIIAFDVDGTLLNDSRQVSALDRAKLESLKAPDTLRIAATGRNCYSAQKVLTPDFPMDYLVFSSGAGVMDWSTKKILYTLHLDAPDIHRTIKTIAPFELNFTIHEAIPNSHHMLIYDNHAEPEDLIAYSSFYKEFVKALDGNKIPIQATQIIVLLNSHLRLYKQLQESLRPLKTILTTSPVNHTSMWMEVFHKDVSKSKGIQWLIKELGILKPFVFAIGNDYNDLDLLHYADEAFAVENAPAALKKQFRVTKSNNENGFSEALKLLHI